MKCHFNIGKRPEKWSTKMLLQHRENTMIAIHKGCSGIVNLTGSKTEHSGGLTHRYVLSLNFSDGNSFVGVPFRMKFQTKRET